MTRTETDPGSDHDASPYVPERADLRTLRAAAADCRGCPLFHDATQTVFGSGEASARVVLLGEQPGDQEDRKGEPFVGPAGRLLDRALDEAGIDPAETYVTNAVKHFKFARQEGGKRRIHKPPNLRELTACKPWLAAELDVIDPELVVVLGATAGKALLGKSFRVTRQRGVLLPLPDWHAAPGASTEGSGTAAPGGASAHAEPPGDASPGRGAPRGGLLATIHPSAALRSRDRDAAYAGLVSDLTTAARALT